MSLYYRDAASNQVTVAARTIMHTNTVFTNTTHFVDFELTLPAATTAQPWVGKKIGVQFLSTVGFEMAGGYWDIDHVRLTALQEPVLKNPVWANGQFQMSLQSDPGLRFEILRATNIALPSVNWLSIGTVTNLSGSTLFADPNAGASANFYRAKQLP
jgi:hypothetical protein